MAIPVFFGGFSRSKIAVFCFCFSRSAKYMVIPGVLVAIPGVLVVLARQIDGDCWFTGWFLNDLPGKPIYFL